MLKTFVNSFRVPEIRKKLMFTAAMLAIYRFGAHVPAPGIDPNALDSLTKNFESGGALGLLNLVSGGSLQRFAIFALGVMPYITASIILQLMQVVVPALEKLKKEGEVGQQKITQYTRYLTVGLSFAQSIGFVFVIRGAASGGQDIFKNFGPGSVFVVVTTLTAGAVLVMWLGELITQR
ncbi:MAG: preprotein translocase subunit SecY, partial [Thermoleophilaceae bacterium]